MRIKNDSLLRCFLSVRRLATPGSSSRHPSEKFSEDLVVTRGDIEFFDVTNKVFVSASRSATAEEVDLLPD